MKTEWKRMDQEQPCNHSMIFIKLNNPAYPQPQIAEFVPAVKGFLHEPYLITFDNNLTGADTEEHTVLISYKNLSLTDIFAWLPMPEFTIEDEAELNLQNSSFYRNIETFHQDGLNA